MTAKRLFCLVAMVAAGNLFPRVSGAEEKNCPTHTASPPPRWGRCLAAAGIGAVVGAPVGGGVNDGLSSAMAGGRGINHGHAWAVGGATGAGFGALVSFGACALMEVVRGVTPIATAAGPVAVVPLAVGVAGLPAEKAGARPAPTPAVVPVPPPKAEPPPVVVSPPAPPIAPLEIPVPVGEAFKYFFEGHQVTGPEADGTYSVRTPVKVTGAEPGTISGTLFWRESGQEVFQKEPWVDQGFNKWAALYRTAAPSEYYLEGKARPAGGRGTEAYVPWSNGSVSSPVVIQPPRPDAIAVSGPVVVGRAPAPAAGGQAPASTAGRQGHAPTPSTTPPPPPPRSSGGITVGKIRRVGVGDEVAFEVSVATDVATCLLYWRPKGDPRGYAEVSTTPQSGDCTVSVRGMNVSVVEFYIETRAVDKRVLCTLGSADAPETENIGPPPPR